MFSRFCYHTQIQITDRLSVFHSFLFNMMSVNKLVMTPEVGVDQMK